ncbi:MAG: glycosyltransferase [Bacteroidota bacterium]
MKISIILITYNQENYINQAIESVLMQRFDGEVEVIIADDSSSDKTLSIIESFESTTQFKFKYLKQESNLGYTKNYKRAFVACDGDYIAIMEGDDYWIDPYRLQKHVDFLDNHRECVMSMNRFIQFVESESFYFHSYWEESDKYKYVTSQMMAVKNNLGNLSACVFRTSELKKINQNIFDLKAGVTDWILGMSLGLYGYIVIFKDIMSVYRVHNNGEWSKMDENEKKQTVLREIEEYNQYLGYKYDKEFKYHLQLLQQPNKKNLVESITQFVPPIIFTFIKLLMPPVFRTWMKGK